MTTERAYLTDPLTLEFEAEILDRLTLPDSRKGLLLGRTYFYPTGGGQDHDTGTLGPARVVDVFSDDAGNVVHVVDGEVEGSAAPARIDRARRLAFMQHHSAQHLLSGAVETTLGLETIAVKINIDSPSTIDFPIPRIDEAGMERAEALANAIIYEDRPIRSYFVPEGEIGQVPLRRPPKVTGEVRIVEIDRFDYSACGGTHCTTTGMIGIVKVLKAERRGEETRIYFVAGDLARRQFESEHSALMRIAQRLNANPETAAAALDKQFEQTAALEKQVKALHQEKMALEARDLAARAQRDGPVRTIVASFQARPIQELRELGSLLQTDQDLAAALAAYDGAKVALVVVAGSATGVRAGEWIRELLAPLNARGGGDARLAQGGGSASEEQFQDLLWRATDSMRGFANRG